MNIETDSRTFVKYLNNTTQRATLYGKASILGEIEK